MSEQEYSIPINANPQDLRETFFDLFYERNMVCDLLFSTESLMTQWPFPEGGWFLKNLQPIFLKKEVRLS